MGTNKFLLQIEAASIRLRQTYSGSGLSKDFVATVASVSVSQLYSWINPNNPRFPDAIQLDRVCRRLETDASYILTGRYENLIHRYLASLDADGAAAARGMAAAISNSVLRREGAEPPVYYYEEELSYQDAQDLARKKLRNAIEEKCGKQGAKLISDAIDEPIRKVRRWISARNPAGFPDPFTLISICEYLEIGFDDVIRDRPISQDFEFYLGNLNADDLYKAKALAATLLSSVYRL